MSHNAITTLRTPGNVSPTISDKGLLRGSIGLAIISLVGFGLLYPLAGVGLGQALFIGISAVLIGLQGVERFSPPASAVNFAQAFEFNQWLV